MAEQARIDHQLLADLAPTAEQLVARHMETRSEWLPHEFVPWTLARDFTRGEQWDSNEFPLPQDVRSALYVNLLTEDNLPFYVRDIDEFAGKEGVWRHWTGIWTFEEGRHSYAIRTFIEATRAIDPTALEKAREVQVVGGQVPVVESTLDGFVYVTLQELATRIAHLKTAQRLKESVTSASPERYAIAAQAGYACLQRVAIDENYHHLLYRDLVGAAIQRDPSSVVLAVEKRVTDFEMPGTGIPGFKEHAKVIAKAGVYNPAIHYEKILLPVLTRQWNIQGLTGLTPEAAAAQERIMARLERLGKIAARVRSKEPVLETA